MLLPASAIVTTVALLAWVWLTLARGWFWRTNVQLGHSGSAAERRVQWPPVAAVIPARDEANVLPQTLPTLLGQDYPGDLRVVLVDDRSEDGTASLARHLASESGGEGRLLVVDGDPLPDGWTGKLWALHRGIAVAQSAEPKFILLTDADIVHPSDSLRDLVAKAESERLDMVSLMARLRVATPWERLLVPAFVFFFAKLFPFSWAAEPRRSTSAAAGGCVLVRRDALERAGGLESIAGEVIDDCALAARIKRHGSADNGRIWLGLSQEVRSVRAYEGLAPIWAMVTRTAFAQLNFSPLLVVGTVIGMLFLYLLPPVAAIGGLVAASLAPEPGAYWLAGAGIAAWATMSAIYIPMLKWHATSPLLAPLLPVSAMLYTLMTVDSARRWRKGEGGAWKGRTYSGRRRDSVGAGRSGSTS